MIRQKLKAITCVIFIFILTLSITIPTSAYYMPEAYLNDLYANGVYYYNPCGGSSNSSYNSSTGTVSGNTNEDKIWNYFVSANISGFSNNAAAIAGVMGNLSVETGGSFNPYAHTSGTNYYGLVQWGYTYNGQRTAEANMIDQVSALGSYWGQTAPTDISDQAIKIELDYLVKQSRFSTFLDGLNKTDNTSGAAGAASYSDLFLVEVEKAIGGSDTLTDSYAQQRAASSHYQAAAKRRDEAKAIYEKYSQNISNNTSSSINENDKGTRDFSSIMNAKNADKQYTDFDPPGATFSDTDTSSMKTLLENYGDLAYQLGRVVGAPYVSILVQMRYEDPHSVCGKNNFWGNGCPPGTGAGGASIQGSNLGEGFQQYGKTLTNGMHDQALGITDPKQYLEKIGPTWVQGNINGPGYGSIGSMKNSVDALQNFINTPEGQAIVQKFGNYSQDSSSNICGTNGSNTSATNIGEAAAIPFEERMNWLFPNGAPTSPSQMQQYLTTIDVPIINESGQQTTMKITVHNKLATEYTAAFQDMVNAGFKVKTGTTGAYVWKLLPSGAPSKHAWGLAIDINWGDNPATSPGRQPGNYAGSGYNPGSNEYAVTDNIIKLWEAHGFHWGGYFSNLFDPMHFSYLEIGQYEPGAYQ